MGWLFALCHRLTPSALDSYTLNMSSFEITPSIAVIQVPLLHQSRRKTLLVTPLAGPTKTIPASRLFHTFVNFKIALSSSQRVGQIRAI